MKNKNYIICTMYTLLCAVKNILINYEQQNKIIKETTS